MKKALLIIFGFCSLSIFAQCKQCSSLEEAMKSPKEVIYLTLHTTSQDGSMTQIPNGIGELSNLRSLKLVNQNISSLPTEIGDLKDLQMVTITGCELTALPESFFKLKNLGKVDLSDNNFSAAYKEKLKARFAKEFPKARLKL